jgi:hypothetical protein
VRVVTEQLPPDRPDASTVPPERPRRRAPWVITVVVLLVAAGVAVAVTRPFSSGGTGRPGSGDADPTGLYTVVQGDLTSETQVSATLGYSGSYSVVNQAQGTVTWLPSVGRVISEGHVLYEVDGTAVILLYGSTPAYRSLSEDMTGPDVKELNSDLVALGYDTSDEIPSGTDEFTWWTKYGVEKLQSALGETGNGTLSLGQVVFEPTAIQVTSVSATLGAQAGPGQPIISATSDRRQVSIALDSDMSSEVAAGDRVTITLPNNSDTPGVVTSVGTVATASQNGGSPTITVLVDPTDPAATGSWDQAPVNVTITTGSVSGVLVVPVDALLAQPNGGYAVEVAGAKNIHHLVAVSLGLFDDASGTVQVSGPGLVAGDQVVVPKI